MHWGTLIIRGAAGSATNRIPRVLKRIVQCSIASRSESSLERYSIVTSWPVEARVVASEKYAVPIPPFSDGPRISYVAMQTRADWCLQDSSIGRLGNTESSVITSGSKPRRSPSKVWGHGTFGPLATLRPKAVCGLARCGNADADRAAQRGFGGPSFRDCASDFQVMLVPAAGVGVPVGVNRSRIPNRPQTHVLVQPNARQRFEAPICRTIVFVPAANACISSLPERHAIVALCFPPSSAKVGCLISGVRDAGTT